MKTLNRFLLFGLVLFAALLVFADTTKAEPPPQGIRVDLEFFLSNPATNPGSSGGNGVVPISPEIVQEGYWTGNNSTGRSVAFSVLSGGAQWKNFDSYYYVNNGICYGTLRVLAYGPGNIANNQFSWSASDGSYRFSGQFPTDTTASGTYSFNNFFLSSQCGYLTTSGTWSARAPAPPAPPPPGPFAKNSPTNGATNQLRSPVLTWKASAYATRYEYCITTSGSNCDTGWVSVSTSTSARPGALAYDTLYFWQVRATNSTGQYVFADNSSWWSFTTQVPPPGPFVKTSPVNGSKGELRNVTLSWDSSPGATSYQYCIGSANKLCDIVPWKSNGLNTSVTPVGLGFNKTFYWQVRARNGTGTKLADGGVWWAFTTEMNVEDKTSLIQFDGWRGVADVRASGKSYRVSNVTGDTAAFSFTGTAVTWVTSKGPTQGQAQVMIDGVDKGMVDNYAALPQFLVARRFTGLTNTTHLLTVQVLGTKNDKATDTNIIVDSFVAGLQVIPENSPRVKYNSWEGFTDLNLSGRTCRMSATAGAVTQVAFTGTRIDWITAKGPAYGQANVFIDGVQQGGTIDLYDPTQQWQVPISFTGLSAGSTHILQIQVLNTSNPSSTGTSVPVDAFHGLITTMPTP